ncbi:GNAT family N-acetyltransferase [Paraconexibacter algicola]|uniref:GNAT family N-acetyltransferase n=1 Tax=Paraconexibacter algicola TaxID=2133960 RepID=A0A2T4UKE3_9ACTN|nr:GNAT family N-acetyltransferase [Paraconexibacter algicola]PTL59724.1 GNAT family N-acetyltransferase [Paraconexibacter algicola]
MAAPTVTQHPDADKPRFEAHVDGRLAGYAEYLVAGVRVVFTHTEVDPAFEGQGVGGALARAALDWVRTTGELEAVPVCPFVAGWIHRHPDYADLVTPALRPQFQR